MEELLFIVIIASLQTDHSNCLQRHKNKTFDTKTNQNLWRQTMNIKHIALAFAISVAIVAPTSVLAQDTKMVTDVSGNQIEIPASPQRVAVAWDRGITELVTAAGITPVAVASTNEFAPFLVEALNNLEGIIDLGSHREINIEALVSAQPDLIIIQDVNNHGNPDLLALAQEIAPVVQLNGSIGLRLFIEDFGAIFGAEYADILNAQVDEAVAKMAAVTADPSAVLVSNGMLLPGTLRLYKDNSNLASQLMAEAGFGRPDSQLSGMSEIINDGTEISMEEVGMLNGDILFLGKIGTDEELSGITSTDLWNSLPVVKNGLVVNADWRYWNVGGPLAAAHIAQDFVAGFELLNK